MSDSKEPKKKAADPEGKPFELKSPAVPAGKAQGRLPLKKPEPTRPPVERRKRDSVRLVWDSKPKRPPSPRDIEFQTAEVVIPNPARDKDLLPTSFRDGILGNEELDRSQMNRLIWGDNLLAMQALLSQGYEGKIDLIYIDPPFNTDEKFNFQTAIDLGEVGQVGRQIPVIERLAYADTWEGGTDSYLDMLYPRFQLIRRLLADAGSAFVHVGPNVSHYVKILLDEVFAESHFRNEIVWQRHDPHNDARTKLGCMTDRILWYSKGDRPYYDAEIEREDLSPSAEKEFSLLELRDGSIVNYKGNEDRPGRRFKLDDATWKGTSRQFLWRGAKPSPKREWMYDLYGMEAALASGELYLRNPARGAARCKKKHLDENKGIYLQDIWDNVGRMKGGSLYPTQKPGRLLERIVRIGCPPGGLVADFFAGAGTTLAAAEASGRRWIGCDLGKVAIQVSRAVLVRRDAKPFLIENIGNYQREMIYLSGGRIFEMQKIILKLYGATPHPRQKDLGTRQAEDGTLELVHVGYPDRPTTARKVEELAHLAQELDGTGYKRLVVLAWDYDYNFDAEWEARLKAMRRKPTVDVQRRMIPPDVIDYLRKARSEEDFEKLADKVVFHEKPYLKLAAPVVEKGEKGKRQVTIAIDKYVVFDLPVSPKDQEKLREVVKDNFAVLIDYWAVDWNYDGATFRSEWQALRGIGKHTQIVPTEVTNSLDAGRKHTIAVRVVDIFGNDAAATCEVKV